MRINRIKLGATVVVAAGAIILSGCAADSSGSTPATGEPIKVAALSGLTFFPEAPQAVQAVFDDYNDAGGFKGQPIEYTVYDDKTDPAASATAAKDALDGGAVALVGSSSLLDCAVNHTTWEDNNIVSLQGTGVDSFCFATPNIAAANAGPYFDTFATLYDGSENLGFYSICAAIVTDDEVGKSAYEQAIAKWYAATGQELAYVDDSLTRGQASYAGNVADLKGENCDAIIAGEVGVPDTAIIGEASNQGLCLPLLVLTSCYSDEFAAAVTYAGDIHVPAEFSPFTDPNDNRTPIGRCDGCPRGADDLVRAGRLPGSEVLHHDLGDDRRRRDTRLVHRGREGHDRADRNPMVGTPWIFGEGDAHQANRSAWPLVIEANTNTWISLGPWLIGDDIGWVDTTTG